MPIRIGEENSDYLKGGLRMMVLVNTSMASFISTFTSGFLSFAVPQVGRAFSLSLSEVMWVPLSFLIPLASFMIFFGKLSDVYGRVNFFRIGFVVLATVSLLINFISNIYELIVLIFVMGLSSAILAANSTAIISTVYPRNIRGSALGINAMSVYLGYLLAPFIGGLLIQFYGWRSIFIVDLPVGIFGVLLSILTLRNLEIKRMGNSFDVIGSILFPSGLILIVLYISISEVYNFISFIYLPVIGLIILLIFFINEKKKNNPLIDLSLFHNNRTFAASNLSAFFNYTSTFAIVFIFSIYLQTILKFSSFDSGLVLASEPLFMVAVSPISGKLTDRYGSREIAALGMSLIGASFIILFLFMTTSMLSIIVPLSMIGIGFGLFSAPNTYSVMGSVQRDNYGVASGTLGTMRSLGQLSSISLASFILASTLPRKLLLEMFSGYQISINIVYYNAFKNGFKSVMLVFGILSLCGAFISLLKTKKS